ncbi:putative cyclin-dependent serine/threonine-protein kinase DDB_G0272797/DDB_G0274007 [Anopheles ziemanni]|uniref:putative cyclin-dependent serine/threonine-protein kinase DDB_G0272797/DDB_G0274007 n=1 Tax=Anopheles coustani TaxID=139045 RepID=UPI002657EE9E|nr:putative cyclin-dependent serine/threonine-protein kinase DDB_G0272797/DDB_G0274007 [Anopheles coustani]XP_058175649.1 putative cyclin-dependent serine/threonine-protein kinase DDB_G0272797/DDB_G0274007 [Anopheles ziemanni]
MATINPCTVLVLSVLCGVVLGQLSFHNDPSQNSFSIKLPAFQQTFTRYFGNQPQGALLQQQQQQQQQQPFQAQYQQQQQLQQNAAQTYQLQQRQQQQPDGINRYVAQFPEQPHYTVQENYINPNIRQRIQQQRLQQQQQQQQFPQQVQPQQYYPQQTNYQGFPFGPAQAAQDPAGYSAGNQQPQYEYIQQPTGAEAGNQAGLQEQQQQQQQGVGVQYQRGQAPASGEADPAAPNKLIGVAFSPSNEVSQVKFSSNGLKYNF